MKKKKDNRGGPREGAGRHKGEETVVKRIPISLVKIVDELIYKHKHVKLSK